MYIKTTIIVQRIPKSVSAFGRYLVEILVMCATSWCDLDLTFDLAYLMLFYVSTRISDTLYLSYISLIYLYPQTKVGDILDSGPSRRRRNFLVDAIT